MRLLTCKTNNIAISEQEKFEMYNQSKWQIPISSIYCCPLLLNGVCLLVHGIYIASNFTISKLLHCHRAFGCHNISLSFMVYFRIVNTFGKSDGIFIFHHQPKNVLLSTSRSKPCMGMLIGALWTSFHMWLMLSLKRIWRFGYYLYIVAAKPGQIPWWFDITNKTLNIHQILFFCC